MLNSAWVDCDGKLSAPVHCAVRVVRSRKLRTLRYALLLVAAVGFLVPLLVLYLAGFSTVALIAVAATTSTLWLGIGLLFRAAELTGAVARQANNKLLHVHKDMSRFAYRTQRPAEEAAAYARRASDLLISGAELAVRLDRANTRARVLFVTSNGHGLGHVTRCLAIANSGADLFDSSVLTLSSAELPDPSRIELMRFPSRQHDEPPYVWNLRFQRHLSRLIEQKSFDAVLFDGPSIFPSVIEATLSHSLPLGWICRGLWRESSPAKVSPWQRECCDLVIVPGEEPLFVPDEYVPKGLDAFTVPPIIGSLDSGFMPAESARHAVGLNPGDRGVLISLGAVSLRGQEASLRASIEAVRDLGKPWKAVVARSPLDRSAGLKEGELSVYPVAPHLLAFDAAIVAAGYNTIHEIVAADLPSVVIPNPLSVTDDQVRRAAAVEDIGLGVFADSVPAISPALQKVVEQRRERSIKIADGGRAAAEAIYGMVRDLTAEAES